MLLATVAACAGPVAETPTTPGSTRPTTPPSTAATVEAAVDLLLEDVFTSEYDLLYLEDVVNAGDLRAAWVLADLLRFYQTGPLRDELVVAFTRLTETDPIPGEVDFVWTTNHLIASDVPALPNYHEIKESLYSTLDSRWGRLFNNDETMGWRMVTLGWRRHRRSAIRRHRQLRLHSSLG